MSLFGLVQEASRMCLEFAKAFCLVFLKINMCDERLNVRQTFSKRVYFARLKNQM